MVDIRVGKRIKQCREEIGLTQSQLAEKIGISTKQMSAIERGAAFPHCENLIKLINELKIPSDAIFCDVVDKSRRYTISKLSAQIEELPPESKRLIYNIIDIMIQAEKN